MDRSQGGELQKLDWALDGAADRRAADAYRAAVCDIFEVTIAPAPHAFRNRLETYHLGSALLGRGRSTPQSFRRTGAAIRRSGVDPLQVILQKRGTVRGDYDGRSIESAPGSLRIVDMARPFHAVAGDFDLLSVTIPRNLLPPGWAERDLHGVRLDGHAAAARLLAMHLRTLWSIIGSLTVAEAAAAATATPALLGCALAGASVPADQRAAVDLSLLAIAKRFIAKNLGNPYLRPDTVRLHLGVSPRTLYRLFADIGGVSGFIQRRRLDRAFRMLADREDAHRPVASIGYANGFLSDAHFSRSFKARFGISPGDARGAAMIGAPPHDDAAESIAAWLRTL